MGIYSRAQVINPSGFGGIHVVSIVHYPFGFGYTQPEGMRKETLFE